MVRTSKEIRFAIITLAAFTLAAIAGAAWVFTLDPKGEAYPVIGNADYRPACPVRGGDVITYPGEGYVRVSTNTGEYCIMSLKTGLATSTPGFLEGRRKSVSRFTVATTSTASSLANR